MHTLAERERLDALTRELAKSPLDRLIESAARLPSPVAETVLSQKFQEAFEEERDYWPPSFRSVAWWGVYLGDFSRFVRLLQMTLASDPQFAAVSLEDCRELMSESYGDRLLDQTIGEAVLHYIYGPELEEDGRDPKAVWRSLTGAATGDAMTAAILAASREWSAPWSATASPPSTAPSPNDIPGPAPPPSATSPNAS